MTKDPGQPFRDRVVVVGTIGFGTPIASWSITLVGFFDDFLMVGKNGVVFLNRLGYKLCGGNMFVGDDAKEVCNQFKENDRNSISNKTM